MTSISMLFDDVFSNITVFGFSVIGELTFLVTEPRSITAFTLDARLRDWSCPASYSENVCESLSLSHLREIPTTTPENVL